ncbi:hypothetical protein ACI1US_01022 [Leucobacter sp. BZR 635]
MLVKEAAQLAARRVLKDRWDDSFPVDPIAIAAAYGIEVSFESLLPGISGAIVAKPGDVKILIEENENFGRQMFTAAHELGHFIERRDKGDNEYSFVERRTNEYDLHEFYADEFAGNLLMPEDEFRRVWGIYESEYMIASHFGVSPSAAAHRKRRLGI